MSAAIIGTWEIVAMETRADDGTVNQFLGPEPRGLLVYTPDGWMTAHVTAPGRPRFASEDMRKGTPAELLAAFNGYIGYFGRYEWREEEGVVLHHIVGSLFPNWEGDVQRRIASFEGDLLRLSTPPMRIGDRMVTGVVVWRRAGDR
jgi:hypothetical protein